MAVILIMPAGIVVVIAILLLLRLMRSLEMMEMYASQKINEKLFVERFDGSKIEMLPPLFLGILKFQSIIAAKRIPY
eukprot:CAMPEP_0194439410 /NCGR_PEP_ID=MMETSP0176-20130528/110434_1 /TAXON_ID=216777 /ORGANISM="Proboscia alata, Strain PI-D3" /LENGTH=76 /DNA_ID=CAMNT_0039262603 /DNA_START=46 /DNA_END=273 /DNA_ORIENTATION=-